MGHEGPQARLTWPLRPASVWGVCLCVCVSGVWDTTLNPFAADKRSQTLLSNLLVISQEALGFGDQSMSVLGLPTTQLAVFPAMSWEWHSRQGPGKKPLLLPNLPFERSPSGRNYSKNFTNIIVSLISPGHPILWHHCYLVWQTRKVRHRGGEVTCPRSPG